MNDQPPRTPASLSAESPLESDGFPKAAPFTPAQQAAIQAQGNTLVMAGAGTGKTHTLVETCVQRLLAQHNPIGLDQILMVTFTEAAAAEMRQRIRARLELALEEHPDSGWLIGQLAALDTAHICTLHSFCLKLIREHFHELDIDPELTVLAEEQSILLASDILDAMLTRHYDNADPFSQEVRQFLQTQTRGWEDNLRDLILQIHHFTQTRPDPDRWFASQLRHFSQPEPVTWRQWLLQGFASWRDFWRPVLANQEEDHQVARRCLAILDSVRTIPDNPQETTGLAALASAARDLHEQDQSGDWAKGKKTAQRKPLEKLFQEARFLSSVSGHPKDPDPLTEDWQWVRGPMTTLLRLAAEFHQQFGQAKRDRGCVDFHDLEQLALRLLWDAPAQTPTALAKQWQQSVQCVMVDEYQDINEAQDTLLRALSRDAPHANRFLVGDVKQSIYRFRQAAPRLFQNYARHWARDTHAGQAIYLQDNFRSQPALLDFVNDFFADKMHEAMGGVAYDQHAMLRPGNPAPATAIDPEAPPAPPVEVILRLKPSNSNRQDTPETGPITDQDDESRHDFNDAEAEAALIGSRLLAMKEASHAVWDPKTQSWRPADWKDMVILLRSPKSKTESFAKEFARLGIPLEARRAGFFDSIEVQDVLQLLHLLDNPLQDLPTAAVLRSPLVGLTLNELAQIRLAEPKSRLWTALRAWHQRHAPPAASQPSPAPESTDSQPDILWPKVNRFLQRYDRWRAHAQHASLAQRLEMVLDETHYLDWLLTQDRGEQRQANVRQLLILAREFDTLHAQGLHRFLTLIHAQQTAAGDREPAPLETGNAVRLMSVHQSKGLEFPVVVVADLGKPFNFSDQRGAILLDEQYGLCPSVRPPHIDRAYPSVPLWLARQHQRRETLGEELRILYVAMTRAQHTLILCGTCSDNAARTRWPDQARQPVTPHALLQANSFLDWLGPWWTQNSGCPDWTEQPSGHAGLWQWNIHESPPPLDATQTPQTTSALTPGERAEKTHLDDPAISNALKAMCDWNYPFATATHTPSKTSITTLRRQFSGRDEETVSASFAPVELPPSTGQSSSRELSSAEVGLAHHKLLQLACWETMTDADRLAREADRLQRSGFLSLAEKEALRLEAVTAFWQGPIGQLILDHRHRAERELPFTCRFSEKEINKPLEHGARLDQPDEFVVVQGVADLVVFQEEEIWLLDFKTDQVTPESWDQKLGAYRPQLKLYAMALERIYRRPVTRRWLHFLSMRHTEPV